MKARVPSALYAMLTGRCGSRIMVDPGPLGGSMMFSRSRIGVLLMTGTSELMNCWVKRCTSLTVKVLAAVAVLPDTGALDSVRLLRPTETRSTSATRLGFAGPVALCDTAECPAVE